MYLGRVARGQAEPVKQGFDIFLGLMETVIDRLSDILEMIGRELDNTSKSIFQKTSANHNDTAGFQAVLVALGRYGDLNGKLRESLLSLSRVFSYMLLSGGKYKDDSHKEALETYAKDISSLTEHATYVSNRVNLLLDATLGMVNIEQNTIIKIFSVAAVVFLAPTLIASIYDMNFEHMPELEWLLGYPFAVGLMILSAILPYLYFKKKGWL
jgi:magnesium transporter